METDTEQALRDVGLRATAGRVAVLDALASMPHSNADHVFRVVSSALPTTSIQSVHNILADLTMAGLTRRVEPAGSASLYERRVNDNHHHVVCSQCGAIADVDCVVGHTPCLSPSATGGFTVQTAEVTFWGVCPDCTSSAA